MFKKACSIFIVCIICIVPLIITPWRRDYYYEAKAYCLYGLCSAMLIFFLYSRCRFKINRQTLFSPAGRKYTALIFYVIMLCISAIFSVDFKQSLLGKAYRYEGLLVMLCYTGIFFIASAYYKFSKEHLYFFMISSSIISVYAVFQFFGYNIIKVDPIRIKWAGWVYATLGNPNFLASYLILVLPVSIFCFGYTKKYIYLFFSELFFFTLLLTRTRGAWLGFIISMAVLVRFAVKGTDGHCSPAQLNIKQIMITFCLMCLIILGLNIYTNNGIQKRFASIITDAEKTVKNPSSSGYQGSTRIFIWKRALHLIPQRPLTGYGPDTFDIPFMERYEKDVHRYIGNLVIDKAHNEYLQIAVATGLPSLLAYLMFLYFLLRNALKNANKNILIIPLFCSISGYLVQAFFNISVVSVAPVFWAMLGILDSFSDSTKSPL